MLPEKYCEDSKQLQASLQQLTRMNLDLISFAHGETLSKPLPALKKLLG
jgi:hypothetical protein